MSTGQTHRALRVQIVSVTCPVCRVSAQAALFHAGIAVGEGTPPARSVFSFNETNACACRPGPSGLATLDELSAFLDRDPSRALRSRGLLDDAAPLARALQSEQRHFT